MPSPHGAQPLPLGDPTGLHSIQFTFEKCSVKQLSVFPSLCHCPQGPIPEHSYHPKEEPHTPWQSLPAAPPRQPLTPTYALSVSVDLPVLDFAYKQNQAGHAPAELTSLTEHQVLKAPGSSLCQTLTPFHENNTALCDGITLHV